MRVLLATQFFPPVSGGEERHVQNLGEALVRRGHQVSVVTQLTPGTVGRETTPSGISVYRTQGIAGRIGALSSSEARPHHPSVPDPWITREISRVVAAEKPDVVHAHNWIINSVTAARLGGAAVVLTLHDYGQVCATQRLMLDGSPCTGPAALKCLRCASEHYDAVRGPITALTLPVMRAWKQRRVDEIIVVSRAVGEGNRLERSPVPWSVVPNFIPDDLSASPRPTDAEGLPDGEFLLFVGDLTPEKGVNFLFEAYERLGPDRPPLLCVGKPTAAAPLAFPEGVTVRQEWPHASVIEAFRRCMFAVLPSLWPDPCPTTVLEAMALRRPVVTTRLGGMRDMVRDGIDGFLVEPGYVSGLSGRLRELIDDPQLRDRQGNSAVVGAKAFAASSVIPRIEEVYERVRARRG